MFINKRLIENIFSLLSIQGLNYLLPLIVLPYLVRVLGPEKYGLLAFSAAFTQYFIIISDYGFNFTATKKVAINQDNNTELSNIFNNVMFIKSLFLFSSIIILILIVYFTPKFRIDYLVYITNSLSIIGNYLFPMWFFQGMEKMKYISIINIFSRIISTLAIFVFVHQQSDYLLAIFLQSIGLVISGLISLYIVKTRFQIRLVYTIQMNEIISEMKESGQVFIATLAGNVYGQGAILIIGLLAGQTLAGYYSLAQKVSGAVVGLVQPIAQALYPYLCNLFINNKNKYFIFRQRSLILGGIVSIFLGILSFYSSYLIAKLVSGSNSEELINLIKIFSVILIFTIMNVLLNPYILSMDKFKEIKKMYLLISILFLICSLPLTKLFGSYGMAGTITFVEIYIFYKSITVTRKRGYIEL